MLDFKKRRFIINRICHNIMTILYLLKNINILLMKKDVDY